MIASRKKTSGSRGKFFYDDVKKSHFFILFSNFQIILSAYALDSSSHHRLWLGFFNDYSIKLNNVSK